MSQNSIVKPIRYGQFILLGAIVLTLLTFLVLLQSSPIWRLFPADTASDTLILYALSSLNFFAFVVFAFIFLRQIIKLALERRSVKVGSKLKTRLVVYFVAVSLLPIAAMAMFSYLFLNRALEKWFSRLPETVIAEAKEVQKRQLATQIASFGERADLLALYVDGMSDYNEAMLQSALRRGNLSALEIVAPDGEVTRMVENSGLSGEKLTAARQELELMAQTNAANAPDGIKFDDARIALSNGGQLLVVSEWRDETNVSQAIANSPIEFEKLKERQTQTRQLGFWTLSLLTFLLIFAASWIAFHLGRNLTAPIRALAEASNEFARGNLKFRVQVAAEDELGLLVESFNQMANQLEENQSKLNERRDYIETVLQSLSTGVVSLDENNLVTTINPAAKTMLRRERDDNQTLTDLVTDNDRETLEKLIARARRLGFATAQTVLQRENNQNDNQNENNGLPVALAVSALREASGKTAGTVLVIEDLTELLQAQRAAAWSEVARRMAHEIKNPLTPIQLAAERIARKFAEFAELTEFAELLKLNSCNSTNPANPVNLKRIVKDSTQIILREVASLKSMVDEFAQFARLPNAQLEPQNLNEIVRQAVSLYQDRLPDIKLKIELSDKLPLALIDAEQMRRVLVNLIDNAVEAFDETQIDKQIHLSTNCCTARDMVIIEVADTGRGFAIGNLPQIFQPYFSTKGRGTGLGLAIVQRIVTEHGGRIHARANQPNGARFVVELPV